MTLFWSDGLVARFPGARDAADAVRRVGALLVAAGAATPAYVEAAVERETEQPTGLPAPVPFALAHTDAEGALRLAAAVGVFDRAVSFRRMDDPDQELPVRVVAVLAVPTRHLQAEVLSGLLRRLADPELARALLAAPGPEAAALLRGEVAA